MRYKVVTARGRYENSKRPDGYSIEDAVPRFSEGEDVEGVGFYRYSSPRKQSSTFGWYKRKSDAKKMVDELNRPKSNPKYRARKARKSYSKRYSSSVRMNGKLKHGNVDKSKENKRRYAKKTGNAETRWGKKYDRQRRDFLK